MFILPALIFAGIAQSKVKGAFERFSQVVVSSNKTGAQVAKELLAQAGISDVDVEYIDRGNMGDHYDPRDRTVRLSKGVYDARSIAALGIAAHEVGHAIQHHTGYVWLGMRNAIVPATQFGSRLAFPMFLVGLFFAGSTGELLMGLGILLFAAAVAFQVITLPVEYNASSRAMTVLESGGYIDSREKEGVRKVLNAAALTYLAAALMAAMQLVYLILLRGRRR